jgi:6-phosphogluconolactonase (cycloisomerase 2 family)
VFCRARAAVLVLAPAPVLLAVGALFAGSVFGAERRSEVPPASGTVYIESNSAAPDSNEILAFHYRDGVLSAGGIRRYRTRGSGSHDLSDSGVLDADQEVIVNSERTLLFAVNSSSDTIAVFHIRANGVLVPVMGSPFPSNGRAPSSLGLAGDTLIVANKAQDGVRDLSRVRPNYTSFRVRSNGSLSRPISSISVPAGSSPLQAYVTPDGKILIASEETGVFRAFRIGPGGRLTQGPGSPVGLPPAVFPGGQRVANVWPAGLVSHPRLRILYAQLANLSETIVYRWDDQARLTFVRALPNRRSLLPCWTHVNAQGTRMYSGNAGSDNLTVFDIAQDPTNPRQIQSVALNAPGNPWNFQIDPTGRVIFLLDMRAVRQIPPGEGNQLHALRIGAHGRLTEEHASPVNIPVPVGTNPVGLAIVPGEEGALLRKVGMHRSADRTPAESALLWRG